jgi:uncharacterized membrane protein
MTSSHNFLCNIYLSGNKSRVCNEYSSLISVAIAYSNRNQCANAGGWTKVGWHNISPGQRRVVSNANLKDINSHWFYYAYTSDRKLKWAGTYCTYVTDKPFRMCWNEPSVDPGYIRAYKVCFRLLDINSYNSYTLRLHN